ncbi:glycosyltransferase [Lacinutrix jangbogonensis]|uniref:glycosyltransferase n=1 Tax=Lacinutrix jangbogonensis TaxID=1469557 RepID=UPI00053DCFA9|nr:glycosyltransferase [Lacinutrix jangbogonensis]
MKEQIVICMALKNAEKTLEKSLNSVLQQVNTKREVILLVGIDNSADNSEIILKDIASNNPNVVLLNVDFDQAYLNRNFLNDYARKNYPNCALIGRLDADDVLYCEYTISYIEALFDKHNFDVLLCGNKQVLNGDVLEWENKPSKELLKDDFLLNQLFEMTQGNSKAELASCNTFIKPTVKIEYPKNESAEDHWFTVLLLLQKEKLNILIDEELLYCFYSLDGVLTHENKNKEHYTQSREELYNYCLTQNPLTAIHNKWRDYMSKGGMSFHESNIIKNKERLENFWKQDYPLNKRIEKLLKQTDNKKIRLLDIGCGPFPKSGIHLKNLTIDRTLVDTMADDYHALLEAHNINTYNQKIIKCEAENLKEKFESNSFEMIFFKNALDHTYNPIKAISNSIDLLTSEGIMVLEHYIKEGEYTNYFGLHQWNFFIENGHFYISNKSKEIIQNLNIFFKSVEIESFYEGNKIINIIKKNNVG